MRPFMQSSKTKQWDQIFIIYTGNKGRTLKFESHINHVANVCIRLAVVHLLLTKDQLDLWIGFMYQPAAQQTTTPSALLYNGVIMNDFPKR